MNKESLLRTKELPSLEYLKECFIVSDESPSGLVWAHRPPHHFRSGQRGCNIFNARYAGDPVGYKTTGRGNLSYYWAAHLDGQAYRAHRIRYSLHHGEVIPAAMQIDHIDGNGLNNSIGNLRQATAIENARNRGLRPDNKVGVKGIGREPYSNLYFGRVYVGGKQYSTRGCRELEDAVDLLTQLRERLHGDFAKH